MFGFKYFWLIGALVNAFYAVIDLAIRFPSLWSPAKKDALLDFGVSSVFSLIMLALYRDSLLSSRQEEGLQQLKFCIDETIKHGTWIPCPENSYYECLEINVTKILGGHCLTGKLTDEKKIAWFMDTYYKGEHITQSHAPGSSVWRLTRRVR